MKVLISSYYAGGIGGAERSLWSVLRALDGHDVDLITKMVLPSVFSPEPGQCNQIFRRPRPWRFWRYVHAPVQRLLFGEPSGRYDLYLHYPGATLMHDRVDAAVKGIVPAGMSISKDEKNFDFVLMESPDNSGFNCDESKRVLLPPPVYRTATDSEYVKDLPAEFLLTVFNPYNRLKGADEFRAVCDDLPMPIVWCFSDRTLNIRDSVFQHPKVIPLLNASQEQLRYLYERCAGYVSFSMSEGFGWAIADALLYNRPVISRNIGVVTFLQAQPGLYTYGSTEELRTILLEVDLEQPAFDISFLSGEAFVAKLTDLVSRHQARPLAGNCA